MRTHRQTASRLRRGFTLFEMLITIGLIAVLAALVIPTTPDDGQFRVMAASRIVLSDIELAQTMTMSSPTDPVIVKFDSTKEEYWLAYQSTPDTPLTREDTGEAYLVQIGTGRASAATGVDCETTDLPNGILLFNAQGGVFDITSAPFITLTHGSSDVKLVISTTTGTVTEE